MNPRKTKYFSILILLMMPIMVFAHGIEEADQLILQNGNLMSYIWVGAKHMLTGYDHILFLVGVIFYLTGIKDILRFITVFTIGHSITLIFATYLQITANEHLIDAVIALSVLYKGFENLDGFKRILNIKSPNLLGMVFIFGLIHGFGLSARLQAFDIGSDYLLAKIVSFNIGVELGQIIALIPIVFIIAKWKKFKSYQTFYKIANWFLIFAGIGLFIYQIYSYTIEHAHNAEHHHIHSDEHHHDHNGADHSHDHDHDHDHEGADHSHDHDHDH